jgi:HK97 family phage prohead protease
MPQTPLLQRAVLDDIAVRAVNVEKRSATFVAASERGVLSFDGPEHLRMSGLDLKRYRRNPVVLDSHNRDGIGNVIGRADVKIEDRELLAEVTFASTPAGETAWQLVRDGFVRALSVGYHPDRKATVMLAAGETDGTGEHTITGPASVTKKWELYEISVVPVPADDSALRRSPPVEEEAAMPKDTAVPAAPAKVETPPPAPPLGETARADEVAEERTARIEKARREAILAIAPDSLRDFALGLVAHGVAFEDARKALVAELEKRAAPVGTPEPKAVKPPAKKLADVPDDVLARSICAPSA